MHEWKLLIRTGILLAFITTEVYHLRKDDVMATSKVTNINSATQTILDAIETFEKSNKQLSKYLKNEQQQATAELTELRTVRIRKVKGKKERLEVTDKIKKSFFRQVPVTNVEGFVTEKLASALSQLPQVPGDRKFSPAHLTALKQSLKTCVRPFHWAIAILTNPDGTIEVFRLDGQHSAHCFNNLKELFETAPNLILSVYDCDTMEDVRKAYQSIDLRQSGRGLKDLLYIEMHGVPALAGQGIDASLLQSIVSGICYHQYHNKWDTILPQEKIAYVRENAAFILWMHNLTKPFKRTYKIKVEMDDGEVEIVDFGIRKFLSAPCVASMYEGWKAYVENPVIKHKFYSVWLRVLDRTANAAYLDDAAVAYRDYVHNTSLVVSRSLKTIEEITNYDTWYYRGCQMTYHAMRDEPTETPWENGQPFPPVR